jgi:hypothetical protein
LKNGNYDVKSATKKQIILTENDYQFPDYQRVFPKNTAFCQPFHCNGKKFRFLHEVYKNYTSENESFDDGYLNDSYMENSEVMIAKDMDRTYAPMVIYDGENKAAVVMPCKLNA